MQLREQVDQEKTYVHYILLSFLDGSVGKKGSNSGYWAPSNADEDEKQGGIRDKKYEGYSNLKGSHEMQQKKTQR